MARLEFEFNIEESITKIKNIEVEIRISAHKKFTCSECSDGFGTKNSSRKYKSSTHAKPISCEVSEEIFDKCWKLKKHLRNQKEFKDHTSGHGEIPLEMKFCTWNFASDVFVSKVNFRNISIKMDSIFCQKYKGVSNFIKGKNSRQVFHNFYF